MPDLPEFTPEEIEKGQKVYDQLDGLSEDVDEPSPEEPSFRDLIIGGDQEGQADRKK